MIMDLLECIIGLRPDVTWKDGVVNAHSLSTIAKTYQSSEPFPTQEEFDAFWDGYQVTHWLNTKVRPIRDAKMDAFEWRISRHHREIALGIDPTDDLNALHAYMQALADFPSTLTEITASIPWPEEPGEASDAA